jgi:hypothetical protein
MMGARRWWDQIARSTSSRCWLRLMFEEREPGEAKQSIAKAVTTAACGYGRPNTPWAKARSAVTWRCTILRTKQTPSADRGSTHRQMELRMAGLINQPLQQPFHLSHIPVFCFIARDRR